MEFENKELNIKFSAPDDPTVRWQLRYKSALLTSMDERMLYERLWAALCAVIRQEDWHSKHVPELSVNALDELSATNATLSIEWASLSLNNHFLKLGQVPKN